MNVNVNTESCVDARATSTTGAKKSREDADYDSEFSMGNKTTRITPEGFPGPSFLSPRIHRSDAQRHKWKNERVTE